MQWSAMWVTTKTDIIGRTDSEAEERFHSYVGLRTIKIWNKLIYEGLDISKCLE